MAVELVVLTLKKLRGRSMQARATGEISVHEWFVQQMAVTLVEAAGSGDMQTHVAGCETMHAAIRACRCGASACMHHRTPAWCVLDVWRNACLTGCVQHSSPHGCMARAGCRPQCMLDHVHAACIRRCMAAWRVQDVGHNACLTTCMQHAFVAAWLH
eukprot:293056-Chlamydomonas_euryale.AAC.1